MTDHVYLNISIGNDTIGEVFPAVYRETKVSPILDRPQDYYLAITRFSVPTGILPLLYFRIEEGLTQNDPDLGIYKLGFKYNNINYETNTIFQNEINTQTPVPPSENGGVQVDSEYYYLYTLKQIAVILNQCLQDSHVLLVTANPLLAAIPAPFLIVTSDERLSLIYDRRYITNNISITFNRAAGKFFRGFRYVGDVTSNSLLLGTDPLFTNAFFPPGTVPVTPPVYLIESSNASSIDNIYEVQSIIFRTSTLPVRTEYTSAVGDLGINTTESILTDFELTDWSLSDSRIQFQAAAPYRFIDLIGQTPIRMIDIEVLWKDRQNRVRTLQLYGGNLITIKLAFVRRGLVS